MKVIKDEDVWFRLLILLVPITIIVFYLLGFYVQNHEIDIRQEVARFSIIPGSLISLFLLRGDKTSKNILSPVKYLFTDLHFKRDVSVGLIELLYALGCVGFWTLNIRNLLLFKSEVFFSNFIFSIASLILLRFFSEVTLRFFGFRSNRTYDNLKGR